MELVVRIDLEEVWVKENLNDTLKEEIKHSITNKLRKEFTEKFEKDITDWVRRDLEMFARDAAIAIKDNIIKTQTIKERSFSDQRKPINEWLDEQVTRNIGSIERDITYKINEMAKAEMETLRKRYDEAFAKGIVENMDKMGLLKDNALTKLLGNQQN